MRTLRLRLRAAWVTLTGTGAAARSPSACWCSSPYWPAWRSRGRAWVAHRGAAAGDRGFAAADRTVIGTVAATSMGGTPGSGHRGGRRLLAGAAGCGRVPVASDSPAWASLTTAYVPVTGTAQAAGYGPPQFELTYRTALARYSHIVAGRLPAGGAAGRRDGRAGRCRRR
jgi:hypothetical protein